MNIYNLYITFGTIPCLYSQINLYYDNYPSYVWYRSGGHFNYNHRTDLDNLKYHYKMIGSDNDYLEIHYKDIVKQIKKIKKRDQNAKFNIFIDDSRVQFFLKPFIMADIYKDINNITMISEGNITEYLYRDIKEDDCNYQKKRWNQLIKQIQNKNCDDELSKISNYCFWLSTKKNVQFLLPYYELLESSSISEQYRNKMNLLPFDIEGMYKNLPREYKQNFIKKCTFEFDSSKKYMIILGTYDFGSKEKTALIYENLIDQMRYDYQNDYILVFKAHPLFPVSSNKKFEEYLQKSNIGVLPEKLPLETLLWDNPNIMIGGFCSSVNSLIDCKRTKFFFGEKIGFVKLLSNNKMFFATEYNILLSQKLASNMLDFYYNEVNEREELNKKILDLELKYGSIVEENRKLNENIDKIESKLIHLEENLIRIIINRLKKKLNLKR